MTKSIDESVRELLARCPSVEAERLLARSQRALETLRSVPERTGVGYRAGRLQRQWGSMEVLPTRSRSFASLPLERRRDRRYLRSSSESLLCRYSLERERRDSQRAYVRSYEQGEEPRRRREGVLLLLGQHANSFLHEIPLQISSTRFTLCGSSRGERSSWPRPARI